jgi:hypothetical protein
MKRSIILLLILHSLVVLLSCEIRAGQIDAQVLQYKLDRFYFNVGKEALVYPGHHFAILRAKDTVVAGLIEESYDGISIGRGNLPKEGKRNFEKYKCLVETAETERLSLLRIGAFSGDFFDAASLSLLDAGGLDSTDRERGADWYTAGKDTILVEPDDDTLSLFDKLDRHLVSAVVYPGSSGPRPNYRVYSVRAPFIAVLLPNLAKGVNREGLLSASLAYRFDPKRIQSTVTRQCEPMSSFRISDSTQTPVYPFDAAKGKELFRQIDSRPERVRIRTEESLRPIAVYFADVLAREQCRTDILADTSAESPDFDLMCLGFSETDSPERVYGSTAGILKLLSRGVGVPLSDALTRLTEITAQADTTQDTMIRDELYTQADRILIHELGCFPLFRPMYTLVTWKDISGIGFNAQGQITSSDLKRLILPVQATKEER